VCSNAWFGSPWNSSTQQQGALTSPSINQHNLHCMRAPLDRHVTHAVGGPLFLWQVCNRFMRKCPQIAEKAQSVVADDGDDASSYGTEESSETPMETSYIEPAVSKEDDITTLIAAVAAFSKEQNVVIEKLDFLEKIVGTVQFDMINVRDDMKAVNVAMERIAGHVCGIRDGPAEVQIRKEQVSLENSLGLPSTWNHNTVSFGKGPSTSTSRGEPTYQIDDVPFWNTDAFEGDTRIEETQAFAIPADVNINRLTSIEVPRREWGYSHDTSPAIPSPPVRLTTVSIDRDAEEEESQQIEMSCQSTQLQTPMNGRGMLSEFEDAVRGWPAPTHDGITREEGWVSTKKGRWDLIDYPKGGGDAIPSAEHEFCNSINLNLLPDRHGAAAISLEGGVVVYSETVTAAIPTAGAGTNRGSGRGNKLPSLSPRFFEEVRGDFPACGQDALHWL
jgi:hypothetical protein